MEANWSNNKKPSILGSFDFGVVSNCTENRPTAGANYANSVPWQTQLDMIQNEVGGNAVRIGVNTTNSGSADKTGYAMYDALLKAFLPEIVTRNMKCIVLLIDQATQFMGTTWENINVDLDQTDQELTDQLPTIYQSAFDMAAGFATIYGPSMTNQDNFVIELGNEPELFRKILKQGLSGGDVSHYWPKKLLLYRTYYRGMYEGIRSVLPTIKCSTPASSGFAPAYMWAQLLLETPDVDYVSWHWYDEHERIMTRGDWPVGAAGESGSFYRSIFDWLWARYGKRIIITECNARGIGFGNNDGTEAGDMHQARGIAFFSPFLRKAVASEHVDIITAYKLLSEPYQSQLFETSYGLFYYEGINTTLPPQDQDWSNPIPKKDVHLLKYLTS